MSAKRISSGRYTTFLSSLDPITIALVQSAFRVNRIAYLESQKDNMSLRVRAKPTGSSEDHFDVRTSLYLSITPFEERKPVVRFVATYDLHFHGEHISEENITKFVESDVRLIVWPYFRELVSNVSARMHVPPIVLPIRYGGSK